MRFCLPSFCHAEAAAPRRVPASPLFQMQAMCVAYRLYRQLAAAYRKCKWFTRQLFSLARRKFQRWLAFDFTLLFS
jgi:hypothetical protein